MDTAAPQFTHATPTVAWAMRISVGANLLVVVFCASYLLRQFHASGVTASHLISAPLVGYFLADFVSGAVHWAMDTWFDERALGRAIAIAREHHIHPQSILDYRFLDFAALGSAPSAIVFGCAAAITTLYPASALTYYLMIVWFILSLCMLFGTSFHNLAHKRSRSALIRLAQRAHLLCPPAHHWVHHRNHVIHYCVVNGWANYVCDTFLVWRGLEWAIQAVTGAVPRRDDLIWQQNYKATGIVGGSED